MAVFEAGQVTELTGPRSRRPKHCNSSFTCHSLSPCPMQPLEEGTTSICLLPVIATWEQEHGGRKPQKQTTRNLCALFTLFPAPSSTYSRMTHSHNAAYPAFGRNSWEHHSSAHKNAPLCPPFLRSGVRCRVSNDTTYCTGSA